MTENKPAVDENKLIKDAIKFINDKIGNSYYNTAVEIGDYVLAKFFDNDIKKVKSKLSNKELSFSKLCYNSELKIHPKHLNQMVLVAAQEKIFKEKKKEELLNKLNYSLKVELLRVNTNKQKFTFAKHFIENDLTVKEAKKYLNEKLGTVTGLDIIPFTGAFVKQFSEISKWAQVEEIIVDYSKIKTSYRANETIKNIDNIITPIAQLDDIKTKLEKIRAKIIERDEELQREARQKDDAKAAKEAKDAEKAAAKTAKAANKKTTKPPKTKGKTQGK